MPAHDNGAYVKSLTVAEKKGCTETEADVRAYLHDLLCPVCSCYPWEHPKERRVNAR